MSTLLEYTDIFEGYLLIYDPATNISRLRKLEPINEDSESGSSSDQESPSALSNSSSVTDESSVPESYDESEDEPEPLEEVLPADLTIQYHLIAGVFKFKKDCPLRSLLEVKASDYFVPFIQNFPLYRVLEALIKIIFDGHFYDRQNPWIIWCEGNELFPIFKEKAIHYNDLKFKLLKILTVDEEFLGLKINLPCTVRNREFLYRIEDVMPYEPPWFSEDSFVFHAHEQWKDISATTVCSVSNDLLRFSDEFNRMRCYNCVKSVFNDFVKVLPRSTYEFDSSFIYFPCDKLSQALGGVKAFTTRQIELFLNFNLEITDEIEPPNGCENSPFSPSRRIESVFYYWNYLRVGL